MIDQILFAPFKLTGGRPINWPIGNKIVFFALHRVRQPQQPGYTANDLIEMSQQRLEAAIKHLQSIGAVFVGANDLALPQPAGDIRVHLTMEDGYKDQLQVALPLLEHYNLPFTLFLTTGIPDRQAVIWWCLLDELFRKGLRLQLPSFNIDINAARMNDEQKEDAFDFLKDFFHENYFAFKEMIDEALAKSGLENTTFLEQHGLTWHELRQLAKNRLCALGNHTHQHFRLSKLSKEQLNQDVSHAQKRIQKETGQCPKSFAFPFGAADDLIDASLITEPSLRYFFTRETGIIRNFSKSNHQRIPRYALNDTLTPFSLNMVLNGLHHRAEILQQRLNNLLPG